MSSLFLKCIGVSFIISSIITLLNVFLATGVINSFWNGVHFWFWMMTGPGIGIFLGTLFRQFLMPDAIYTSGGVSGLLKAKIFWTIGPQSIGWLLGVLTIAKQLN
ncbi:MULTISPECIES: hypothetical protein [Serratia]|uniref:hypothetical protein n=1 Tax=Serratia TaxID=613 RepID=UPI0009496F39|nr:hypothetical protein [Serratia sp. 506_PEND]